MSLTNVSYSMITGTPVNVLDYGADPTNTSDSTAAIVAATTYANANNKSVYFPAGSYKYVPTAPLECSSFIGESAESTAIYVNCASYSGVVFRNTGGLWANLTIRETNLIKTSGILYQVSAATALNALGGAASFTAYAKLSRVWVFGGQYALDIGNMFTCEFDHCRFNQADTGVNCTPLVAGGGYANTLNFISCEIADNNRNCYFNPAGGPALAVTFTNGSIERALTTTSTFSNCTGISFYDVYLEQTVAVSPITIISASAYCKFVTSGSNCDLTIGTNANAVIEGWNSGTNHLLGSDGTNSVVLQNCAFPSTGNALIYNWATITLDNTSYSGTFYASKQFLAGIAPYQTFSGSFATVASASTLTVTSSVTFVSGTTTISSINVPTALVAYGGQITLIPTGGWATNTAGNIALSSTAIVNKALTLFWDPANTKWYPSY